MANHKTGTILTCPCGKEFYVIASRIATASYCSLGCLSRFTAKQRSEKQRTRTYPYLLGACAWCNNDFYATSAGFVKTTRRFCSYSCRTAHRNSVTPKTATQMAHARRLSKTWVLGRKATAKEREAKSVRLRGNRSHFWKGGLTDENRRLRNSPRSR
jgi:hypothetical protein